MAEDKKEKAEKGFGEGIEVVKDAKPEEKDIEINFGKVFSFFKKKENKTAEVAALAKEHHETKTERKEENPNRQQPIGPSRGSDLGKEVKEEREGKGEEETEIDLGKLASGIKGIFKGFKGKKEKGTAAAEKEETKKAGGESDGDEVSINIPSVFDFLKRRGQLIFLIAGILISIGLTANVRLQPAQLHFTEDWAKNSVSNTIQSDIQAAINEQYPNLPEARKSQILAGEMDKARKGKTYVFKAGQYKGQQIDIKNQIKGTAEFIKDFYRDENGRPYSPDIDPYYWYRYAKNVVEKGRIGDEVRNGQQWDTYQVAPLGRAISSQDFSFPYFVAYLYKFVRFFNPSATLWSVQTTWYPVIATSLTILLIFLIGRKIAGNVGGFFASIMAGLHVVYVNRTIHGDNDAAVILFAVLTLWLFVQAIYSRKMLWQLTYAVLAGLSLGVFSLGWGGWWFIFLFILAASATAMTAGITLKQPIFPVLIGLVLAAAVIFTGVGTWVLAALIIIMSLLPATILALLNILEERNPIAAFRINPGTLVKAVKDAFISVIGRCSIALTASTAIFVSMFSGAQAFLSLPGLTFGITKLKTPVLGLSFWPNVLTTVAELNEGNFDQAVNSIRPGIFWLSALSAAILVTVAIINFGLPFVNRRLSKLGIKPDEKKALYSVFFAALVVIWFIGTIYASTKGIRFVLLIAPAVGLGFGITLGLMFKLVAWINDNFLKVNKVAIAAIIFAIMATATYSTDIIKNAESVAKNDVPIINDAWYNSLNAIKDDSNSTTKDAILTSWWDFGHHFKAIADRRVTFDGTTQQGPQAHWVGKFFMTKDETEAAGILRMLDCGSNTAFETLNSVKNDFAGSIKALYRITAVPSREEAKRILMQDYSLTENQAINVTQKSHCDPPEAYVIASEDMIGKSGVWGHFGSWDFERGIIWQTLKGKPQKEAVEKMKDMFNYSEEKAKAIYGEMVRIKDDKEANSWIAPWPSFSGELSGCGVSAEEGVVKCNNGLIVNLTTNDAYFPVEGGKVLHPVSFVYMTNQTGTEEAVERAYTNDTIPQRFSTILVPQGQWLGNSYEGYYSAVASPEQAAGMFTRMFFFEGRGLKHFKLLTHQRGLTGTNVYVYKADWESLK